jgi:hypothetical protein
MEKFIGFNLNEELLVQLNPEGFVHWKHYEDQTARQIQSWLPLYAKPERPLEYYLAKRDADGWVAIQAFQFLAIFGDQVRMGTNKFSAYVRLRAEHTEVIEKCE